MLPEGVRAVYEGREPAVSSTTSPHSLVNYERGSISPLHALRMAITLGAAYVTYRGTESSFSNDTDRLVATGLVGIVVASVVTLATRGLERRD